MAERGEKDGRNAETYLPELPPVEYFVEPFNAKVAETFWADNSQTTPEILTFTSAVCKTVSRMESAEELLSLVDYIENRLTPIENEDGYHKHELSWGRPSRIIVLEEGIALGVMGKITDVKNRVRTSDWLTEELAKMAHHDLVNAANKYSGEGFAELLKENLWVEQEERLKKLKTAHPGHIYHVQSII